MNEKYTLANKVHENMTIKVHMTTAESTQYELLTNYTQIWRQITQEVYTNMTAKVYKIM